MKPPRKNPSPPPPPPPSDTSSNLPDRPRRKPGETYSLLTHVLEGRILLPKEHRHQRQFFRLLKRVRTDPKYLEAVHRLRDSIVRSALVKGVRRGGLILSVSGVNGNEGTSFLSLLLALALGSGTHYRVAFLDGRFSEIRFEVLAHVLSLSRNSCEIHKGDTALNGFYNKSHPNVYVLRKSGQEHSLEFFSDHRLQECLTQLRQQFDFTIVDMPPVLGDSTNSYMLPAVDQRYLVVQAGRTRLADVDRCIEIASQLETELTGVIVNGQKTPLWSKLFWKDYFV
jgi:Mrp family chromosome partitioning ATPase